MIFTDIFFDLSLRNVRLNFVRSILAATGIVIGVIAITSIGILGANMSLSVTQSLSDSGNVLSIYPNGAYDPDETYISKSDLKTIERVSVPNTVIPFYVNYDSITTGSEKSSAQIYGIEESDIQKLIEKLDDGYYPKSSNSVLVGHSLAETYKLKAGSRIKIGSRDKGNQKNVRVSGIISETGMSLGLGTDNAVVITDKIYNQMYDKEGKYDQINVILRDIESVDEVKEKIENAINKNKKDSAVDKIYVFDAAGFLEGIKDVLGAITGFLSAIGGISLLVAAVSIFNVMMMSVTERIKEIGILRSIGTKRKEIRRMFLYEAFILGLGGSIIGALISVIFGYLAVLLLLQDTNYFFTIDSLLSVPIGIFIGTFVCVLSGVYPAWKASKLDPIKALATE
ncbi:ABC transporter permease [Methanoplanus sp. FWC-SCC4]|uniref:ABC transporter permease n=1 Tax=Methanochimaera problematica TaxID=2609417 RepID=A0AA97I3T3_9EURY|nr:FtsX-like permease family protein [Methanoplanus sp. FWC-SCC4]WOF16226.1 ABC transporter permease [Methanoplanus sp. FWC-SCC4]